MPLFPTSARMQQTNQTSQIDTVQSSRSRRSNNFSKQLDDYEEPPQIYLRNYETTKDRCERVSQIHKASLLRKTVYDPKKIIMNGNNLRTKLVSKEKHMPLKLAEVNEPSRIKDGIADRAGVSLRESFDLELFTNPVWKSVDKQKWRSKRGMSY